MPTGEIDYALKKRRLIIGLLLASVAYGVACLFIPEQDPIAEFIISLPILVLAVSWCFTDAEQRRFRIGRINSVALVLLFVVGFPVYLFRTRGLSGFKALALAFAFGLALMGCALASSEVAARVLPLTQPDPLEYIVPREY